MPALVEGDSAPYGGVVVLILRFEEFGGIPFSRSAAKLLDWEGEDASVPSQV